jgi:DNA mismatch repair protein MSH6
VVFFNYVIRWQFKSHYYDTVLFFKVGKFYEMFHMDAVVGVEHLKLAYMRGNYAHCGFPESAYGNFAEQLVRKGFKVARIEQTETPSQLADRNTQMRTNDKVVKREICRITSQATQTYSAFEAAAINDQEVNTGPSDSNFLMSICEKVCF